MRAVLRRWPLSEERMVDPEPGCLDGLELSLKSTRASEIRSVESMDSGRAYMVSSDTAYTKKQINA